MKRVCNAFILLLSLCFFLTAGVFSSSAFAFAEQEVVYSDVLSDLQKSEDFDVSDYPVILDDYGLYVVTIAESENNELFVYVYQPCFEKNFRATCVNMSCTADSSISPRLYRLSFINKSGTLYKYKLLDFVVSSDVSRFYEIYSIFRRYDETIDDEPDDSTQTSNEVSFGVGRKWAISSSDDSYLMEGTEIEVITVTDKFVGFVRYPDGFVWLGVSGACDSHFVAFSTDKNIDKLYEADVYYTSQSYRRDWSQTSGAVESFGTSSDNIVTLDYTDKTSYQGVGLFSYKYVWNRIESVSDFISNTENSSIYSGAFLNVSTGTQIDDTAKQSLQNKQWVLRFAETPYHFESAGSGLSAISQTSSTSVGNVSILRLYFESEGRLYNLGVVDNKQTGSDTPINHGSSQNIEPGWLISDGLPDIGVDWLKIIFLVLGFILLLFVVCAIIRRLYRSSSNYHRKKSKNRRK